MSFISIDSHVELGIDAGGLFKVFWYYQLKEYISEITKSGFNVGLGLFCCTQDNLL